MTIESSDRAREVVTPLQIWRRINEDKIDPDSELFTLVDSAGNPVKKSVVIGGKPDEITYTGIFKKTDGGLSFAAYPTKGNLIDLDNKTHQIFDALISSPSDLGVLIKTVGAVGFTIIETADQGSLSDLAEDTGPQAKPEELSEQQRQQLEALIPETEPLPPPFEIKQRLTELSPRERRDIERAATQNLISRATSELVHPRFVTHDKKKYERGISFLATLDKHVKKLNLSVGRIQELGKSGAETKTDGHGMALTLAGEPFRGEHLGRPPQSFETVPTLIVTVWQKTAVLGPDQAAPDLERDVGRLIKTLAAVRSEIERIRSTGPSHFRDILQQLGIRQVRFEYGSPRSHELRGYTKDGKPIPGEIDKLRVPILGAAVPEKKP